MALPNARDCSTRACAFRHTTPLEEPCEGSNGGFLMARMIVVDRDGKEHEIEAKTGLKIMEVLRELDYGVAAICGGLCSCATCHIYVDEKWVPLLPKRQSDELELLNELPDFREATSRLSCQVDFTEALSGIKVTVAADS
jgi:ferredoxin, 2Fe-2S